MFIVGTSFINEAAGITGSHSHLVLPHLYKDKRYVDAYRRLSEQGHYLLQDNSIFELKSVVAGDLVDFGRQIKATCIMVPEVLRDAKASIDAKDLFFGSIKKEDKKDFLFAAAVQGKIFKEIAAHYQNLSDDDRIDTIAIPFNFEFDADDSRNEDDRQAGRNRFRIIDRLVDEGYWNYEKKHHLLGLFNPIELSYYCAESLALRKSIKTNDSSSCYWHAVYGARFNLEKGLLYRKIETPVDFNIDLSDEQKEVFIGNSYAIKRFIQKGWRDAI